MASSWDRSNTDRWEKGFAALSKFRAREGYCHPPRFHVEGNFKLGPWVATQRYNKDNLSAERKRRLNAIGFVWNWRDYLWDRGFMALLKFKRREGHCPGALLQRSRGLQARSFLVVTASGDPTLARIS